MKKLFLTVLVCGFLAGSAEGTIFWQDTLDELDGWELPVGGVTIVDLSTVPAAGPLTGNGMRIEAGKYAWEAGTSNLADIAMPGVGQTRYLYAWRVSRRTTRVRT